MTIIWNKVTWYSKLLAVFVFAGAIWLGFYFTNQYQQIGKISPVPDYAAMRATVDHALYPIPMGGGPAHAFVSYFKVVGDTVYVLLNIDLDGWAGVSFAIAKAHPVVEKTLLQFPEIKKVVFGFAPGDSKENMMSSSDTLDWKTYRNEKYGLEFKYPSDLNLREQQGVGIVRIYFDENTPGKYILLNITSLDKPFTITQGEYGIYDKSTKEVTMHSHDSDSESKVFHVYQPSVYKSNWQGFIFDVSDIHSLHIPNEKREYMLYVDAGVDTLNTNVSDFEKASSSAILFNSVISSLHFF